MNSVTRFIQVRFSPPVLGGIIGLLFCTLPITSLSALGNDTNDDADARARAYYEANPERAQRGDEMFRRMQSRFNPAALKQRIEDEANKEAPEDPDDTRPAIIIDSVSTNGGSELPMLKVARKSCEVQAESALKIYQAGGETWAALSQELPPGYRVSAVTLPPDWNKAGIGLSTQRDIFYREKYAKHVYTQQFSISEDGRCSLVAEPRAHIEIDNGVTRYDIKYSGKANVRAMPGSSVPE